MRSKLAWMAGALCLIPHGRAHAASVPVGFADREIASGFTSPTALTVLTDGRVLVVQQNGVILVVKDDTLQEGSYAEVPDVDSSGERGCLGIVPDPDFDSNHYLYLYCTIKSGDESNNQIIRVTEADGHVQSGSARVLMTLPGVYSSWHMGGALRFGPDGMLYVAVGNHEDKPQPVDTAHSQNLSNPFGKILRIKPNGEAPSDNPFYDEAGAFKAIWSYGYRNPFAFDIQPGTGRMLVGDVGQETWEEIDDNKRGANYGWPVAEGPMNSSDEYEAPFYAFKHTEGRCSVTGTAFYNPPRAQFPEEYVGTFLFEDFCTGTIQVLDLATAAVRPFVSGIGFPTNLALSPDGSLYYLSRNQDTKTFAPGIGTLSKIVYTGIAAPRFARNPMSQTVVLGDPAQFEVTADGADTLQWQRDGKDIPGATQSSYKLSKVTLEDDKAMFTVVATNDYGATSSAIARLTVTTNRPPKPAIVAGSGTFDFTPGQMLTFMAWATDETDGRLPASAFTWQVDFQHDKHSHPLLPAKSGMDSISFTAPDFESGEANTWLRVRLTARDSGGAMQSMYRDVFPATQLSDLTPLEPVINAWGPVERNRAVGELEEGDGAPLSISSIPFLRGLGVHAPADVRFDLAGKCSGKFLANVGVDDEVGGQGSVVFQVELDGKRVFDSGIKHGGDARSGVAVDVAGVKELRLIVTDAGDNKDYDHGDWAAARLTGCSGLRTTSASDDEAAGAAAAAGSSGRAGTGGAGGAAGAAGAAGGGGMAAKPSADSSANRGAAGSRRSTGSGSSSQRKDAQQKMPQASERAGCSLARPASGTPWPLLAMLGLALWMHRRRRRARFS